MRPDDCQDKAGGISRRRWLAWAGSGAVAAGLVPGAAQAAMLTEKAAPARRRSLRVAHLSDIHVQPELNAAAGLTACLRHMRAQADPPEFILNTGDCVMDVMRQDRKRGDLLWSLFTRIWKEECPIPTAYVLGNHDIWGWHAKSGTTGTEPGWGKGMALEALGMSKPYHAFDRGGWHFIGLDSVQKTDASFMTRLDDEQFAWLEADLAATDPKTPILIMSHMPIFAIVPMFNQAADPGLVPAPWKIDKADMHTDYHRLKDLFKRYPNVKTCLSGHVHLVDRVEYLGVTYLCGGAVSGAWWSGSRFDECDPGYSLIDLYDDGTCERQYVSFGWKAVVRRPPATATTRPATRPAALTAHPDTAEVIQP